MLSKQIIIIFIVSTVSSVLLIGGTWYYKEYHDETLFGLLDPEDKDEYYDLDPEKSFVVKGSELIELKSNTDKMYTLEEQYSSLKSKFDSIYADYKVLNEEYGDGEKSDSISTQLTTLAKKEQTLKDSLSKLKKELDKIENNFASAKKKISSLENRLAGGLDSTKLAQYSNFAKIYNNSSSEEVAKILQNMKALESAYILKMMSKKKAGKVIESLDTKYAAEVLKESGRLE